MLSAQAPALNGASVCKGDQEKVGAEGGQRVVGGGGGPRTQRGPGPNGSGQEAALPLCNTRGGKRKPRKSPFFPPPQGAELKKKTKIHHGSKTSVEFNSAAAALLGFRNPSGFAVVRRPRFFFFPLYLFFLSFSFKSCFTTLHLYFTYNFSHNHHNSSHKQARGGITFLQHQKRGLRGIK